MRPSVSWTPKPIDSRSLFPHSRSVPSRTDMRPTAWGLLGALELAVLDRLWDIGRADAKQLHGRLVETRSITRNTVQSAMKRLHKKGLLQRRKVSHAFIYEPAVTRQEFRREAVQEVVETLLHGEIDAMVTAFIDVADQAGPESLACLERRVIARRRKMPRDIDEAEPLGPLA